MVTLVKVFGTGKKETSFSPFLLKKADLTGTIKASPNLPAGAGKFPPVTCGNRRQSLPAEIFACIRRYFYLQISLPAAFAGNFARASFTVYIQKMREKLVFDQILGKELVVDSLRDFLEMNLTRHQMLVENAKHSGRYASAKLTQI